MTKVCVRCKQEKSLDDFYKASRAKDGHQSWCKACTAVAQHESYQRRFAKPPPARAGWTKYQKHLWSQFGLTPEDYEALLVKFKRRCGICKAKNQLVVDHEKGTNTPRGILCQKCNKGLGLLGDGLWGINRARKYLLKSKE